MNAGLGEFENEVKLYYYDILYFLITEVNILQP